MHTREEYKSEPHTAHSRYSTHPVRVGAWGVHTRERCGGGERKVLDDDTAHTVLAANAGARATTHVCIECDAGSRQVCVDWYARGVLCGMPCLCSRIDREVLHPQPAETWPPAGQASGYRRPAGPLAGCGDRICTPGIRTWDCDFPDRPCNGPYGLGYLGHSCLCPLRHGRTDPQHDLQCFRTFRCTER